MSYFRSGDPLEDFDRLDREQAEWEAKLPQCENRGCKHRVIQDELYFDIDGEILCEACVIDRYGRSTQDFVNDQ